MSCVRGCLQPNSDVVEESNRNRVVYQSLVRDKQRWDTIHKLLFIGAGGSGKTTLFKQLNVIHGSGYSDKARLQFKNSIHRQVILEMQLASNCVNKLAFEEVLSEKAIVAANQLDNIDGDCIGINTTLNDSMLTESIVSIIEILWNEPAIRKVYELRGQLGIEDSSAYFWNEIRRITANDYIPTVQDLLLVRMPTSGIIQQQFTIDGNIFNICDLGGQQSERRKWIHCFDNVTAVIFVASLASYNRLLMEDQKTNMMMDSLKVFDEIANNEYFVHTPIILFLNKKDLCKQKIKDVPITTCFKSYQGDTSSFEEICEYIEKQFTSLCLEKDKEIFTHITTATNKQNIETVFNSVQYICTQNAMKAVNML